MVELALVVGVLIAIALIIVDFGKAFSYWNDENQVADQAARIAAVGALPSFTPANTTGSGCCANNATCNGITVTDLMTYIDCELKIDSPELVNGGGAHGVHTYPGNTNGGATVCISVPDNAVGEPVTVKVTTDYDWLPLPLLHGSSFGHTGIAGTATMRLESAYPWSDSQATACS